MRRQPVRLVLALMLAPLALAVTGCGKKDQAPDAAATSGGPIAPITPPAGKAWSDVVTKTPEGGYRMGNPNAPIKLVEFGSLTCPHCAEFAEKGMADLRDKFVASGRVSYEFRNFVRDAIDITAAQLTRCGSPESFFPLTEQVFANQKTFFDKVQAAGEPAFNAAMNAPPAQRGVKIGQLTGLTEFFASRGISADQANACLARAGDAEALANATTKASKDFDVEGTPTFLINGSKVDINTWEQVKARLESMGAR